MAITISEGIVKAFEEYKTAAGTGDIKATRDALKALRKLVLPERARLKEELKKASSTSTATSSAKHATTHTAPVATATAAAKKK